jgi:hypothetical protein
MSAMRHFAIAPKKQGKRAMRVLPAALVAALLLSSGAHAATVAPTPANWYAISLYFASQSGSCTGSTVGETLNGTFYYAGPGKTGSLMYIVSPAKGTSPSAQRFNFPALPGTNGGQSSGNLTITDLAGGSSTTDTVALTITYGTANAFFLTAVGTSSSSGGTCTQTIDATLLHNST